MVQFKIPNSQFSIPLPEPTPDASQEASRPVARVLTVPLLGGVRGGFMIAMPAPNASRLPALASRHLALLPTAIGPRTPFEFPHRLDGLGTSPWNQNDGASLVAKRPAQFAHEIFPVGFGEQFIAVDKQQKRRRHLLDLCRIKKVEPMAQGADRLPPLDGVAECAVEDRGGDFLLQLRGDITHGFKQAIEVKAGFGRSENHRREIKKEQVFLHPLAELSKRGHEP